MGFASRPACIASKLKINDIAGMLIHHGISVAQKVVLLVYVAQPVAHNQLAQLTSELQKRRKQTRSTGNHNKFWCMQVFNRLQNDFFDVVRFGREGKAKSFNESQIYFATGLDSSLSARPNAHVIPTFGSPPQTNADSRQSSTIIWLKNRRFPIRHRTSKSKSPCNIPFQFTHCCSGR